MTGWASIPPSFYSSRIAIPDKFVTEIKAGPRVPFLATTTLPSKVG
jgi:hypothetical protein